MRNLALALSALSLVMVAVLLWRVSRGSIGTRTLLFGCLTAAVVVACVVQWRRAAAAAPAASPGA